MRQTTHARDKTKQGSFSEGWGDKHARKRAEHCTLPPTRKACRVGTHLYSVWVREFVKDNVEYDTVRCPDCGAEHTAPSQAHIRRERGMNW